MAAPKPKATELPPGVLARRILVVGWIALGLAGALNHTIALDVMGERLNLLLPHLRYGHVMFNLNPRIVQVHTYAGEDGVRHPVSDLEAVPALGYHRARVELNLVIKPAYLAELCYRATRRSGSELTFFIDEYDLSADPAVPTRTATIRCTERGLTQDARPEESP
jgi:hypothetical protein